MPLSSSTDAPILAHDLAMKVRRLCFRGYQHYDDGKFQLALRTFYQAWLVLPKPQAHWREAGWVLTAIGDAYFRIGKYEQAREALHSALSCPAADASPFIHLRYGQALYELALMDDAQQALRKAVHLGGDELFAGEDSKYRLALDTTI